MFIFALVAPFFATLSLASHVGRQQPASACPSNGVLNTGNFTLHAVAKSNASVQKSLAIPIPGVPVPSYLASHETINSTTSVAMKFTLIDGGITAYSQDGSVFGFSGPLVSGWLQFFPLHGDGATSPTKVYCELSNELAVNGDSDHFSLCQQSTSKEYFVIHDAQSSSGDAGYIGTTCFGVTINVVSAN
ncbi:hypothetical protein BJV78DRAFT_1154142 [Lactifluus subvellereus]|nr:hypothetical protein BJV78DRAFT_1154142 [Lactifluus subvellereus]